MAHPPLTPPECDLRDFPRMMLDITRLRQSDFDATPDDSAWRAGLNLWFSAWHSVPAGSLSDDEPALAKAAGLGRDLRTWRKVRAAAMRGFVLCDDGRYYHETVCEFALEAWLEKLSQRLSSGAGNAKRWKISFDPADIEHAIEHAAALLARISPQSKALVKAKRRQSRQDDDGNPDGTENQSRRDTKTVPAGSQGTGTGNIEEEPPNPPRGDLRDDAFGLAVQAYPEAGRLTVSLEAMGDAWDDEIAAGATPAAILAAAKAFAAGQYADGGGKVPRFDRWLRKGLWKLVAPVTPAVSPLAWHGPPDLLDALRAEMGAGADAFLRLTRWDAGRHAIVTTSGTASDRLKREAGHVLRAAKVEIILEQAA